VWKLIDWLKADAAQISTPVLNDQTCVHSATVSSSSVMCGQTRWEQELLQGAGHNIHWKPDAMRWVMYIVFDIILYFVKQNQVVE